MLCCAPTGLSSFRGEWLHTSSWRSDLDLRGKRVGVIGTGCSAIQVIPAIAKDVKELVVFQRSPSWVVPKFDFDIPEKMKVQKLLRIESYVNYVRA
jgi:cation diffusion facilitator CzcD-associated flavoprotein CzcO